VELYNLLESDVINTINNHIQEIGVECSCEKCKMDIAAIALNNLKPQYVVTEEGNVYGRAMNMNSQFNTNILLEVTKAMAVVGKNPHHKGDE
jgi:competence protein ComFB